MGAAHILPIMQESINDEGKLALWVGFFGMFLPFLYFAFAMMGKPDGKRKFHIYTMMVNGIASIAYLYMATGNGYSEVDGRQFFYARYIDWFFTTPLLLLDLCALGMAGADTTNFLIGMDMLMIVSGVVGAFLTGTKSYGDYHPWVFFAFGIFFFLPIVYQLGMGVPAKLNAENAKSVYTIVSWLTIITWTLYPVVWILAEGTHTLSPNMEVVCYTVMDLLSKSVFGLILIMSHSAMDEALGSGETKPLKSGV